MGEIWLFFGCIIGLIFLMLVLALFIHGSDDRW